MSDEHLSLLIDGELSLAAREAVRAHVASCPACAERHDALVNVTAALRLQPRSSWTPAASARTLARLGPQRQRDWALPLAGLLAFLVSAVAMTTLPVGVWLGLARSTLEAITALGPRGLVPGSLSTLAVLLAVAVLGPLLAYPLARAR